MKNLSLFSINGDLHIRIDEYEPPIITISLITGIKKEITLKNLVTNEIVLVNIKELKPA